MSGEVSRECEFGGAVGTAVGVVFGVGASVTEGDGGGGGFYGFLVVD